MIKINRATKKLLLAILTAMLVFAITFILIQKKSKELDPSRIALIDTIEGNYIFRGNNPFITKNGEKVFAYDELTYYFNDILQKQGLSSLSNYYLIDISLLDLDEYSEITKEKNFFIQHPEYGTAINISTLSPSLLLDGAANSNILTKTISEHYNLWITDSIKKVHNLALNKTDKTTIIYIHCDSGRDRTGLITASYKMLFNNISLANARLQNIAEAGRNSNTLYDRAMRSYCLYANKTYQLNNDCT